MPNSDVTERPAGDASKSSRGFGKGSRAVKLGVTPTWQTEQMEGAGRSRAKNCWRWQPMHEACSGYSVTSAKASLPFRTSFQFAEGNWWHESHFCFACSGTEWENFE